MCNLKWPSGPLQYLESVLLVEVRDTRPTTRSVLPQLLDYFNWELMSSSLWITQAIEVSVVFKPAKESVTIERKNCQTSSIMQMNLHPKFLQKRNERALKMLQPLLRLPPSVCPTQACQVLWSTIPYLLPPFRPHLPFCVFHHFILVVTLQLAS